MKLKDYGTMLEFSLDRGVYYKDIRGFRFYLRYWKYMIYKIPSLYVTLDREITSEELKKLEIAANKNACSITGINKKDTLIISLPVEKRNDPKFKELTDDILDRVSLLLMAEKFNPNHTCFFCGKESNEFLPLGEEYLCMHEECFLGYYQKFTEKYDKYQKTKNRNIYLSHYNKIQYQSIKYLIFFYYVEVFLISLRSIFKSFSVSLLFCSIM